tara:strand:+ start:1316 stop:1549 length:234 start_codon:yes stop_codon:yes gene_type:complete
VGTLKAFFQAATAFLRAWPLFQLSKLHKQIHEIDDEIFSLGLDGSPFSKLRIEQLHKRKRGIVEQIRVIRPTNGDLD